MDKPDQKDFWGKLQVLAAVFASVCVPLVVLVVGNLYSSAIKDSENRLRYVELALQILREEPSNDGAIALREWAIALLNYQSPVPLSAEAQRELKTKKVNWQYSYEDYGGIGDAGSYGTSGGDVISLGMRAAQPIASEGRSAGKPASRP